MSKYLVPQLQNQIAANNSALGWTPGPDGNWVPVALGAEYLPPPQPIPVQPVQRTGFGQIEASAGGAFSGLTWLLIGAALVYFRKPIIGFFAASEQLAEQAVNKMRSRASRGSSSSTALTKRAGEKRSGRRRIGKRWLKGTRLKAV